MGKDSLWKYRWSGALVQLARAFPVHRGAPTARPCGLRGGLAGRRAGGVLPRGHPPVRAHGATAVRRRRLRGRPGRRARSSRSASAAASGPCPRASRRIRPVKVVIGRWGSPSPPREPPPGGRVSPAPVVRRAHRAPATNACRPLRRGPGTAAARQSANRLAGRPRPLAVASAGSAQTGSGRRGPSTADSSRSSGSGVAAGGRIAAGRQAGHGGGGGQMRDGARAARGGGGSTRPRRRPRPPRRRSAGPAGPTTACDQLLGGGGAGDDPDGAGQVVGQLVRPVDPQHPGAAGGRGGALQGHGCWRSWPSRSRPRRRSGRRWP